MRTCALLVAALLSSAPALAQRHQAAHRAAHRAEAKPQPARTDDAAAAHKPTRSKTYTFTGLDIDGRLKTPQLLYFLNRMKAEFDSTTPAKRSFIPELVRSTDEM